MPNDARRALFECRNVDIGIESRVLVRGLNLVLPSDVVQVVATLAHVPAAGLTTQQCWHTIARYGGYLGRKGDGPPGWKTLWKGWFYIQAVLDGVHLAARLSLNSSSDP